jgi:hypothetical protein
MNNQKGFAIIPIIIIAVIAIAGGVGGYLYVKNKNNLLNLNQLSKQEQIQKQGSSEQVIPSSRTSEQVIPEKNYEQLTSTDYNDLISDQEYRDSIRANNLDAIDSAIRLWLTETSGEFKCVKERIYDSRNGTTAVDGTGWIPINLNELSGGSPLSEFYKDPLNNEQYYYSFACNPQKMTYELAARLESSRWIKENGGKNLLIFGTQKDLIP